MRGDHVLVISILFSADHVRGAILFLPKAFYVGMYVNVFCIYIWQPLSPQLDKSGRPMGDRIEEEDEGVPSDTRHNSFAFETPSAKQGTASFFYYQIWTVKPLSSDRGSGRRPSKNKEARERRVAI